MIMRGQSDELEQPDGMSLSSYDVLLQLARLQDTEHGKGQRR
jgi:hypothetical protein